MAFLMCDGWMEEATVKINRIVVHTSIKAVTGIEVWCRGKAKEISGISQAIFLTLEAGRELIDRVDKLVEFLILYLMRLKYFL